MVYMYSIRIKGIPSGYYMNIYYPEPFEPFKHFKHSVHSEHSEHSNRFKRVKHFEYVGLSYKLKEIDFNALECMGR